MATKRVQQRALAWFGSDCMVCEQYAALLADCKHVVVPFCGGLSIVAHLVKTAGEIICNDKHRLAMNFYNVLRDESLKNRLIEQLQATPFHEDLLYKSQQLCKTHPDHWLSDLMMAYHYFITCWMGRSGKSGTNSEFNGGLAMRWDAGGGSSPLRFQTAVRSIKDYWGPICERCSFVCKDWTEIVNKVKDDPKNALYADAPWPDAGDDYVHSFRNPQDHIRLRNELLRFKETKILVRYGDNKLIRDLYGDTNYWRIRTLVSRDQANNGVGELCITNFGL